MQVKCPVCGEIGLLHPAKYHRIRHTRKIPYYSKDNQRLQSRRAFYHHNVPKEWAEEQFREAKRKEDEFWETIHRLNSGNI